MNLETEMFDNTVALWLAALGIALAIYLAAAAARWAIIRQLDAIAGRTATHIDDAALATARATRLWLVLLVALYSGSRHLTLPAPADAVLHGAATVAAFLQAGLWAGALLEFWFTRSQARALRTNAGAAAGLAALGFVLRIALWTVIALLALDNLGVNVTALIAGLGVGGIAVALAVQNILGDLLASLSIVIDKPFVIGDFIVVDEYAGTVEHIGMKTTRLRSLSGEQLIFANGDLLKARLHNYKRMRERRIEFRFSVPHQTGPDQLEAIAGAVRGIVEAQPQVRFDRAHFKGFGESSLEFEVVYWLLDPDYNRYMDTQQAINIALLRWLAEHGVSLAYPTRTLIVDGPVAVAKPRAAQDEEKEAPRRARG